MRLRPHHLLCTQAYRGKGYSEAFVANMNEVTTKLRGAEPVTIELTFSDDDLCAFCPNLVGEHTCSTQDKVKQFDEKCIEYFHLEEGTYLYQDLVRQIKEMLTPEMLQDICGTCQWYSVSACRELPEKSNSNDRDTE